MRRENSAIKTGRVQYYLNVYGIAISRTTFVRIALVSLVLIGLALRIAFASVNQLDPDYSPTDDGDYYRRAFHFATTGQYVDDFWCIRPPLHVLLFAALLRLSIMLGTIDGITLVRMVQIGLIGLTIAAGYDLARRLFNRRAGLIFAFFLAVWFPLVELPTHFFSEPLFFFFLVMHLWLLIVWRDTRRWYILASAGASLGLAALTRSQALYTAAFVLFWLLLLTWADQRKQPGNEQHVWYSIGWLWRTIRAIWSVLLRHALIFLCAMMLMIVPWTIRNYLVYQQVYVIDTTGPILIWLRVSENGGEGTAILQRMPQANRQPFVVADMQRMLQENPARFWGLVWGQAWEHFREVWKAQYVEEFFNQRSFYTRPLREFQVLGLAGDLLWVLFSAAGLIGLAAPAHEGPFRWIALGWISYTLVSVMIWHPEPRYLLPVWLLLSLYGAWTLSNPGQMFTLLRHRQGHGILALALVAAFLALCISYRDYPRIIARGIEREQHLAAGTRAYAEEDYSTAAREFTAALRAQPGFVESRMQLGLTLVALEAYSEAHTLLAGGEGQELDLARGILADAQGNSDQAATLLTRAEIRGSADIQRLALQWRQPPVTTHIQIGRGLDLGYIHGFAPAEQINHPDGQVSFYRWLQGNGQIRLPLDQSMQGNLQVSVRLSAGRPEGTHIRMGLDDGWQQRVDIPGDEWRSYHFLMPITEDTGSYLTLQLSGPTFIPAHRFANSRDIRQLSVMLSDIRIAVP